MRIKICGITRPEDAQFAEDLGADAIGVVLFSDSPRSISPERAREIFDAVGPFTATVAVTHTRSREDLDRIFAIQPHAVQIFYPFSFTKAPGPRVIRAIGAHDALPEDCSAIIVDESHGKGKGVDLSHARSVVQRSKVPVILAGGLTPGNVAEAIAAVHPYAVDVATGVEISPGIKDREKMRAFIQESRRA
ncbi:phosphoribosylanthranilate isomerase [uncultured Methanoregula sp.]|uniref:phosphoribosylanthranilate isomerase n=1 Tax=uncultured Methanoregula sp. TaxID=1005933 RepID=UPI002AAA8CFC|nr:phosphoribosylanthranilate isomerase [uncultured Methanoregula sp.]